MERSIPGSSSFPRSRRSSHVSSKFTSRFNSSSGTKPNKKVKFADFDDVPDKFSGHAKRTIRDHGTGGGKTSEFMYFKKICGTAGQNDISKPQRVKAQESNKTRISVSDQVEKETPSDCIHSISPHEEQLNEKLSCSGLFETPIYKFHKESTHPALKLTPLAQEPLLSSPEVSRNSNAECEGSVRSNKRRNLIKLASKTLSVGVDDFFLRRSDLIGELIQRLGIKPHPENKKSVSISHLETPMEKYTHSGHRFKLENSAHYASHLPVLPSIEAGLEPNIRLGWSVQELENSELYPDFSTGFIHDQNAHASTSYLLPSSPCHDLVPYSYPFGGEVQDQPLVPYACFQSPVEKLKSEPMSWDVKEKEEAQSHLPLALCNSAHFYNKSEEFGGDVFFGSPPRTALSALELNSSFVCERENLFSHISDADFSLANERSLVFVKENSVNCLLEFGSDLPLLNPQYSLSRSNWCAYPKDSSDPFLIDT
ncbi:uncharacterized protein LOC144562354 isoform X2 [Carex rostrata]